MKKLFTVSTLLAGMFNLSYANTGTQNTQGQQEEAENVEVVKVESKEIQHFREALASTKTFISSIAKEQGKTLIWKATGDTPYKPIPTGEWKELVLDAVTNFNKELSKTYGYDEVNAFVCETSLVIAPPRLLTSITSETCSTLYYEKSMKYFIQGKEFNPETLRLVEEEEAEKKLAEESKMRETELEMKEVSEVKEEPFQQNSQSTLITIPNFAN